LSGSKCPAFVFAGRYELIAGDTEHASQVTLFDGSAHVSGNGFELDVHAGETAVM
jgi:hypothetical protein